MTQLARRGTHPDIRTHATYALFDQPVNSARRLLLEIFHYLSREGSSMFPMIIDRQMVVVVMIVVVVVVHCHVQKIFSTSVKPTVD